MIWYRFIVDFIKTRSHKCGHLDAAYIYDARCFGWWKVSILNTFVTATGDHSKPPGIIG